MEEDGKKRELQYKGYDKSADSLRYGFKPQKNDRRFSGSNVRKTGEYSRRWPDCRGQVLL